MTVAERISKALLRLPKPKHVLADERIDEFVDRILIAGFEAGIRPAPPGARGKPTDIVAAIGMIADALERLDRGLRIIDAARRSTAASASARSNALRMAHEDALRAVAGAVASALPTAMIRDVDLAASFPTYAPVGMTNPWRGAFDRAAGQVRAIEAAVSSEDLRTPKGADEWTDRLISILAGIYADATGRKPSAYPRGSDSMNPNWKPPFCQFVADLWPLWHDPDADPPSGASLRRALERGQMRSNSATDSTAI